jgi:hypothetical protein
MDLDQFVEALHLAEDDLKDLESQTLSALDLEFGYDWRSMGVSVLYIWLFSSFDMTLSKGLCVE